MRRTANAVFGVIFSLALLFGAIRSEDPLIRLTCRLALLSVAAALLAAPRLRPEHLRKLGLGVVLVMAASFAALFVATQMFGGGALNGRVTESGEYYLQEHGRETLVSRSVYYLVAVIEMLVFVSWPAGMVLALRPGGVRAFSGSRPEADTRSGGEGRPTNGCS